MSVNHSPRPENDVPPHNSLVASNPPVATSGPEISTAGTQTFVSARMSASTPQTNSRSSGEHTTPANEPTGMVVKVKIDSQGRHYVQHPESGLRFDIVDDPTVPLDTPYYATAGVYVHPNASVSRGPTSLLGSRTEETPSSTSEMQLTESGVSTQVAPTTSPLPVVSTGEALLDGLVSGLGAALTRDQQAMYSSIRGMLSTGRDTLLATTAFVSGQRAALDSNYRAIEEVRKDTVNKLHELHHTVSIQELRTEQVLEESLKALRSFGSTEAQLEHLTKSMGEYNARGCSARPDVPKIPRSASGSTTPLDEILPELDQALPPRTSLETLEAYHRRGMNNVQRKERTAASFAAVAPNPLAPGPTPSAVHFAQGTHFDDVGSISTAPTRPFNRYGGVLMATTARSGGTSASSYAAVPGVPSASHEGFHRDKEVAIRAIIEREVGSALQLPPHIKSPKVDAPTKYRGEDDVDTFMKFVEMLCTWLRAQMLCGHEPSVDNFRLTMLKTHLADQALDWYIVSVNSSHFASTGNMTFTDAVCALHRRFVTSSNAQRATRAFDAVRYEHAKGPDAFAEALIRRANQMNHVPDEFAMNRKFLAGLPQTIRYKLKVDRQMTAEYTPFEVIRTDARQLWTAELEEASASSAARPAVRSASTATPPAGSRRPTAPAAAPRAYSTPTVASARPFPTANTSDDRRTCFKCGIVGHIGTNPICPRYSEPSVPGARVAAQRVVESYAGGDVAVDPAEAENPELAEGAEDLEGLWGGEQYDPDFDPNSAPDLSHLMADEDDVEGVRVGAIQAHYYSLRVPEPAEVEVEDQGAGLPDLEIPASSTTPTTIVTLAPSRSSPYPLWTAANETQSRLDAASAAPIPPLTSYSSLLADLELRAGRDSLTPSQSLELEAISAVGSEENAAETL
ncbi:hypothetical protein C8F04DRAFT_1251688 [Mycena alexandri]|uniref:Uncharacterized protein n=1 Tax=Mycena alexandri TaxID=1745969 RepID=A0AAD6TBH2_9AGAR|nr:hypothetical protein C8F04DRAFT_1251688 [Mycena alexandri]